MAHLQALRKTWRWIRPLGVVILMLAIGGYWFYTHIIYPAPAFRAYDPEMAYLMSSLSGFKGHAYVFVDHPGTPIQVIGSILLLITYPFFPGGSESFVLYHLENPQLFLSMTHALLIIGSMAAVAVLVFRSIYVQRWADAVLALAIAATYFAFHPRAFTALSEWSHNSFNFMVGTLLLLGIFHWVRPGQLLPWWKIALSGFAAGFATAIQFYIFTWIIGLLVTIAALYLMRGAGWWKTLLACLNAGLASGVGFGVATIPIIPLYPQFFSFILGIVFNQGRHGSGEPGIASPEQLSENFTELLANLPLLWVATVGAVILLGAAIVYLYRQQQHDTGVRAFALGITVQLLVTLAIIVKHPAETYMLAVAAILPAFLIASHWAFGSDRHRIHLFYAGLIEPSP